MTILRDVISELFGMFLGDARLSTAILGVVALAAALIDLAHAAPLLGGAVLLLGCVAIVLESVHRAARRRDAEISAGQGSSRH